MLGGASAALAGLVFVGLSIHARAVAADPLHRARGLTAGIVYVTVVSALALTAGQGADAARDRDPHRRHRDRLDLLDAAAEAHRAPRSAAAAPHRRGGTPCTLSSAAGASLLAHGGGGLNLLVPAGIAGAVLNVFGAWSLLLGLARDD